MARLEKGTLSWVLYDVANSGYILVVVTAVYPIFFSNHWATDLSNAQSTYWFGFSASLAGAILALVAPFLGTLADLGGTRKRFLAAFVLLGCLATAALLLAGKGQWETAAALYVVSMVSFSCANIFYDSLIHAVSTSKSRHFVSALGFSMGYLGSTILLAFCLWLIQDPTRFGLRGPVEATYLTFGLTALWWGLFSIPLLLRVPEGTTRSRVPAREAIARSLPQVWRTLKGAWKNRPVAVFLLAYFFYIDGANTIIKMAAKLANDLGFDQGDLMGAIIVVQLVGVPCALSFGWLGSRFGPRLMLVICIIIYIGVILYASVMTPAPLTVGPWSLSPLYLLAVLIGMVQGGVFSLSRSLFANLIPEKDASSFFGLYNIIGKVSTILGPFLVGLVAMQTGSTQTGISVITVFFVVGLYLLFRLPLAETTGDVDEKESP